MELNDYLSTKECEARYGLAPGTARTICQRGQLPGSVKRFGIWFIPKLEAELRWADGKLKPGGKRKGG